jgi:hypothetical protein
MAFDGVVVIDLVHMTGRAHLTTPFGYAGHLLSVALRALEVRERDIVLFLDPTVTQVAGGSGLVVQFVAGRTIHCLGAHAGWGVTERATQSRVTMGLVNEVSDWYRDRLRRIRTGVTMALDAVGTLDIQMMAGRAVRR